MTFSLRVLIAYKYWSAEHPVPDAMLRYFFYEINKLNFIERALELFATILNHLSTIFNSREIFCKNFSQL